MFRADIAKYDLELVQFYNEQRSFVSQMTAAEVMDVIVRQRRCDGQAVDVVFVYTRRNRKMTTKMLTIPDLEYPEVWTRLPIQDPVVPLERNLYGRPLVGLQ